MGVSMWIITTAGGFRLPPDYLNGRIEGRALGILANCPQFLSGAIDSDGSDRAVRFMHPHDCFDMPIVVLCRTTGLMIGPEFESTALVRPCSRRFVTVAYLSVSLVTVVLRKACGLGTQATGGRHAKPPMLMVPWPASQHGGIVLRGQTKLGSRNELAAIADPEARNVRRARGRNGRLSTHGRRATGRRPARHGRRKQRSWGPPGSNLPEAPIERTDSRILGRSVGAEASTIG